MLRPSIDACGSVFLVCLALLGIYGLAQGVRAWKNPACWKALGLHWYAGLGKLFVPKEQRHKLDEIWANEQVVRFFAIMTTIISASGLVVLLVAAVFIYTR